MAGDQRDGVPGERAQASPRAAALEHGGSSAPDSAPMRSPALLSLLPSDAPRDRGHPTRGAGCSVLEDHQARTIRWPRRPVGRPHSVARRVPIRALPRLVLGGRQGPHGGSGFVRRYGRQQRPRQTRTQLRTATCAVDVDVCGTRGLRVAARGRACLAHGSAQEVAGASTRHAREQRDRHKQQRGGACETPQRTRDPGVPARHAGDSRGVYGSAQLRLCSGWSNNAHGSFLILQDARPGQTLQAQMWPRKVRAET
jgi:hypothetical protein